MTDHTFCSRIAQAEEGVFPGTGVRGEIYVFLPVPKALWGHGELNTRWAAPGELDAIRRARRAGVTTRLYNPPADCSVQGMLVYPSPTAGPRALEALAHLQQALQGKGWALDVSGAPRLAICTQGTRDRCCAKWGFAVFRTALNLYRAGQSAFQPLECSHLGGDRYAATGIFFPAGSMYGHLDRTDLAAMAATEEAGRITPHHYRGRVYEDDLTQIVRAGLARDGHGVDATSTLEILNPEAAPSDLRVRAGGYEFRVCLDTVQSAFYGSCEAVAQQRVSHTRRLVYVRADPVLV